MSHKELKRHEVIGQICRGELKQNKAAKILHLSIRQIKRLCHRYRQEGTPGLISKKRGKVSHRRTPKDTQQRIIVLAKERYHGFGPTLMSEKLLEEQQLKISKEALRQLLVQEGLWKAKLTKGKNIHPQRERRAQRGELVQIDGSPHDWFEGRAPKCCLIVFIDDASSEILYLRFEPTETTQAYYRGLFFVIQTYGIPLSLYSDKHSIFRVNQGDNPEAQTQFGRACEELEIELINAHSAPAKGRVERANQTLQDRLIKEMKLAGIHDVKIANQWLEEYRKKHNQRFAKTPREPQSAFMTNHRNANELTHILSEQEIRRVSKNLELSFEGQYYQIQNQGKGHRLQRASVTVCRTMSNEIHLLYQGKSLEYSVFTPTQKRPVIADGKSINTMCNEKVSRINRVKPKASHPWRHTVLSRKSVQINLSLQADKKRASPLCSLRSHSPQSI